MKPTMLLKAILLGSVSEQGVVVSVSPGVAVVATANGTQRVSADIDVLPDDLVTVRGGRIISKRTGGQGGAVKVYNV